MMRGTNRRIWTGVLAGVLAAAVLLTVGVGAYRAGQDDEVVTRVVNEGEGRTGEVVRVVGDHGWRPGFLLFPLLVVLLVVVLFRAFGRHHYGGWHGGWRHGWSPGWQGSGSYGPGPYGPGRDPGDPGSDPRMAWFDEWHRRAHGSESSSESAPSSGAATDETPPSPPASPGSA